MESGGGDRVDPPQGDRTNRGGGGRGGGRGLADGGHQEDSAAAALKGHGHEAKTTWPEEMKVSRPCPSSPRTSSVTSPTSTGTGAFHACVRPCGLQTLLCFYFLTQRIFNHCSQRASKERGGRGREDLMTSNPETRPARLDQLIALLLFSWSCWRRKIEKQKSKRIRNGEPGEPDKPGEPNKPGEPDKHSCHGSFQSSKEAT